MYTMKHRGPSHEPCGTALFIVNHDVMIIRFQFGPVAVSGAHVESCATKKSVQDEHPTHEKNADSFISVSDVVLVLKNINKCTCCRIPLKIPQPPPLGKISFLQIYSQHPPPLASRKI